MRSDTRRHVVRDERTQTKETRLEAKRRNVIDETRGQTKKYAIRDEETQDRKRGDTRGDKETHGKKRKDSERRLGSTAETMIHMVREKKRWTNRVEKSTVRDEETHLQIPRTRKVRYWETR